jgi:hypothetical protein
MTPPTFNELGTQRKALSSVVSSRWAAMTQQREQSLELMCSARAELARALGLHLDEEQDVCRYCESALQTDMPSAPLPEAARSAFDQLGQAVKAAFASEELLQEMMAAHAQERELSRLGG